MTNPVADIVTLCGTNLNWGEIQMLQNLGCRDANALLSQFRKTLVGVQSRLGCGRGIVIPRLIGIQCFRESPELGRIDSFNRESGFMYQSR